MKLIFKITMILVVLISCEEPTEIIRHAPEIHGIFFSRSAIYPNEFVDVTANVTDEDKGDKLTYNWQTTCGHFNNTINNPTQWFAPSYPATCTISLTVSDGYFEVSKSAEIIVLKP